MPISYTCTLKEDEYSIRSSGRSPPDQSSLLVPPSSSSSTLLRQVQVSRPLSSRRRLIAPTTFRHCRHKLIRLLLLPLLTIQHTKQQLGTMVLALLLYRGLPVQATSSLSTFTRRTFGTAFVPISSLRPTRRGSRTTEYPTTACVRGCSVCNSSSRNYPQWTKRSKMQLSQGFLVSQRPLFRPIELYYSTAMSRHTRQCQSYSKSSSSSSSKSVLFSTKTDAETTANGSSSSLSQFAIESDLLDAKRDFVQASDLYRKNVQSAGVTLSILQGRIRDLEIEQAQPDFWNDSNADRALHVNQQLSQSSRLLQRLTDWEQWHGDATAALEMLQASPAIASSSSIADDSGQATSSPLASSESGTMSMTTLSLSEQQMLLEEFQTAVSNLWSDCQTAELEWLLSGPYDACPACRLVLTAGAGGTEATDWVADLVRMYTRYIDEKKDSGWSCRILDETPGDVVGYKNVELLIQGPYAYGWCHGEKGAHRLVRLSPFNAKDKRQTTFAGVDVVPELQDTQAQVKLADIILADSDLEITTMRSGGKGGQNVNKVNSAVRIKHVPSGLSVKCTDERSQSQNKEIALMRLKTQLLLVAQEQRVQELKDIRGDMVEASWGSQIRNYVLHPYKQVKDPRTGWESNNAQGFLDGDAKLIDDCIGAYLRSKQKVQQDDADSASR